MKLTRDEHQALAFIAGLLCLSAAVRVLALPDPVELPADAGVDLAAHIEVVEAAVAEAEEMERPLGEGERVDPNTASTVQLTRLPRVGPSMAERIVEDREANGRYRQLADLGRVAGIGARTLEQLAPFVALPASDPAAVRGPGRVDLNRAGVDDLVGLSGIGPVLAARIVAYRDSVGPFHAVEELARVKGIGSATLERLAERVTVHPGG